MVFLQIVGAFGADKCRKIEPRFGLPDHAVLSEEFDRLVVAGSMKPDLTVGDDAEAVFQGNHRTVIESEQIACQIPKISVTERPLEPVRDPKRTLEQRQ